LDAQIAILLPTRYHRVPRTADVLQMNRAVVQITGHGASSAERDKLGCGSAERARPTVYSREKKI